MNEDASLSLPGNAAAQAKPVHPSLARLMMGSGGGGESSSSGDACGSNSNGSSNHNGSGESESGNACSRLSDSDSSYGPTGALPATRRPELSPASVTPSGTVVPSATGSPFVIRPQQPISAVTAVSDLARERHHSDTKALADAYRAISKKFVIGVCAMDTKARSKPMRNILQRLLATGLYEAVIFGDKVILDESIEHWPSCDFFISFFSAGFPLDKATKYVKLRRPWCINNLLFQELLLDRRTVLKILDTINVPTPRRLTTCKKDDVPSLSQELVDTVQHVFGVDMSPSAWPLAQSEQIDVDTIRVGDQTMTKPFVEKPVSGEDHNIHIYYPEKQGGGARALFRKVANKSSQFVPHIRDVRTSGSYIYEEFIAVDNAEDVKVYTLGEDFAHAETRKSPVIDGIVKRNPEGKEVRYVTELNAAERDMARKVCRAFKQTVCGFDLLRINDKSYVIDVNGWSFVKGNEHYYDQAARIMSDLFLRAGRTRPVSLVKELSIENQWKLKAFVAVMRHADRTPKLKLKFNFSSEPFVALLGGKSEEVVLKKPAQLSAVLAATKQAESESLEDPVHLGQLEAILKAKGHLAGTKVQIKPSWSKSDGGQLDKLQLIVKWGGEFTHGGYHHSTDLGENMRKDLLLINRETLKDVQVWSSSESRVTDTAQVFCNAFLDLSSMPDPADPMTSPAKTGEAMPAPFEININKEMLDDSNNAKEQMDVVKARLLELMNPGQPLGSARHSRTPTSVTAASTTMTAMTANPADAGIAGASDTLDEASTVPLPAAETAVPSNSSIFIGLNSVGIWIELLVVVRQRMLRNFKPLQPFYEAQPGWCCNETPTLFMERWNKLFRDILDSERSQFEPSKVSELYDSLKFDLLHNRRFLMALLALNVNLHLQPPGTASRSIGLDESSLDLELEADPVPEELCKWEDDAGRSYPFGNPSGPSSVSRRSSHDNVLSTPSYEEPRSETNSVSPGEMNAAELLRDLYLHSKVLFDTVSPQEYGIDLQEKFEIGRLNCRALLKQLYGDLSAAAKDKSKPCTRLYFTKESKVICLLNFILTSGLATRASVPTDELDYLSQITFELYERHQGLDARGEEREYSLRLGLSQGAHSPNLVELQVDSAHSIAVQPRRWITDHISLNDALTIFQNT